MDAIELLKQDHKKVEKIFTDMEKKDARPKLQSNAKAEGKPKAAAAGKAAGKKTAVRRSAKG